MPSYKSKKNQIIINGKVINFDTNIKQIYELDNKIIVLTYVNETELDNEPNVCAISEKGTIIWEIEELKGSLNKYSKIVEEEGCLVVYDMDHFKYVVNPTNGKFLKTKIMPLKSINDDSKTLLTKQNLYQLGIIFAILFLLFLFIKPKSNDKEIEIVQNEQNTTQVESVVSETSSEVESTIVSNQSDNTMGQLKDILNDKFGSSTTSKETTIKEEIIVEEEFPTSNKIQETTKVETSNTKPSSNKEEDPYEGINKLIGIFDDVSNAIQTGDATSIEDMQQKNNSDCVYLGVDGQYLKVSLKGEEKKVSLISIKKDSIASGSIEKYLSEGQGIFIEQDIKKDKDGIILAYVWLSEDKDDISNMLNYCLIKNKYATFEIQTPNVKYNYKLNK